MSDSPSVDESNTAVARALVEVDRQDGFHDGWPTTRDGVRSGIAAMQDELAETLDAWRSERRMVGWNATAEELTQVIAVGLRLLRAIENEGWTED